MKIGNVTLNTQLVLAPMAGVTDLAFRTVCRELSGCYTVTEKVSAKALCYGDKKTASLLALGAGEHPAAVQIFGSDEACMERELPWLWSSLGRISSTSTWAVRCLR